MPRPSLARYAQSFAGLHHLWCFLLALLAWCPGLYASETSCTPIDLDTFRRQMDEGRDQLMLLEPEVALKALNEAIERIPCLTGVPSPQQLAQAWQWLGVARKATGDSSGAITAFQQALAVLPELPWNNLFGLVGREEFDKAHPASSCDCFYVSWPALRIDGQIYVDGRLAPEGAGRMTVPPGRHLFQVVRQDRVLWGSLLEASREKYVDWLSSPLPAARPGPMLRVSVGATYAPTLETGGALGLALQLASGWHLVVEGDVLAALPGSPVDAWGVRRWDIDLGLRHYWEFGRLTPWLEVAAGQRSLGGARTGTLTGSTGLGIRLTSSLALETRVQAGWPGSGGLPADARFGVGLVWSH